MRHAAVPFLPRGTKIRRPLLEELSAVWPFSTPMMLRLKCCPLGAPFPVWLTAADSVPASWLPVGLVQATPASAPTARIPATAFVVRMMHLGGGMENAPARTCHGPDRVPTSLAPWFARGEHRRGRRPQAVVSRPSCWWTDSSRNREYGSLYSVFYRAFMSVAGAPAQR